MRSRSRASRMKLPIAKFASSGRSGPTNAKQRAILTSSVRRPPRQRHTGTPRHACPGRSPPTRPPDEAPRGSPPGAARDPAAAGRRRRRSWSAGACGRRRAEANARTRSVPATAVRNDARRRHARASLRRQVEHVGAIGVREVERADVARVQAPPLRARRCAARLGEATRIAGQDGARWRRRPSSSFARRRLSSIQRPKKPSHRSRTAERREGRPRGPGVCSRTWSRSRSGSGRALLPGIGPDPFGANVAPAELRRQRVEHRRRATQVEDRVVAATRSPATRGRPPDDRPSPRRRGRQVSDGTSRAQRLDEGAVDEEVRRPGAVEEQTRGSWSGVERPQERRERGDAGSAGEQHGVLARDR